MANLPSSLTKGDTGHFRKCLHKAGFAVIRNPQKNIYISSTIFNDRRNDGSRRLKLWAGTRVFDAPQYQQQYLEQLLLREFGKRYQGGYFIEAASWFRCDLKSFCIVLSK